MLPGDLHCKKWKKKFFREKKNTAAKLKSTERSLEMESVKIKQKLLFLLFLTELVTFVQNTSNNISDDYSLLISELD